MRWWLRKSREQDLDRELRAHLELEAQEQLESGLSREEARYAARRAFGNTALVEEEVREMWGWMGLERFWQDVRYGARMLRKTPGFTAVAVLSLGLGIGANSAIFALLNAVVLRQLPIANPQQLVQFTYTIPTNSPENWNSYFGYSQLERFREQSRTLSGVFGGTTFGRVSLGAGGISGVAQCDAYTDNFFSVLGVAAQYGRLFVPGDDQAANVAVLSDRYWRRRFGGDPSIVGRMVTLNQIPFLVIGVTTPEFSGLYPGGTRDVWVPLHALDRFQPGLKIWREPFSSWLTIAGRLRPGVSRAQAQAELDVIHRRVLVGQLAISELRNRKSLQRMVGESRLVLRPAGNGIDSALRHEYFLPLKLLLCVAGIVLLISCANVANLVLARGAHRGREIALRMALGSGRGRVIRQLLTETILLAGAGGAVAVAIAWWGGAALVRMISTGDYPIPLDVRPDWRVFGFTAVVSLASGVVFGLAPAFRGTRIGPATALKEGARPADGRSRWLDRALVTIQVTLSLVLITGAGLFLRTLQNLRSVDVGYDRDNVLMFSVDCKLAGYPKERAATLFRAILEKSAAIPGVQSASFSVVRPVDDYYYLVDRITDLDGRVLPESESIKVAWNAMSPGYFSTIGTALRRGRDFSFHDAGMGSKVVIVNETLARQLLPGQNPIGHRIADAEIIGVVKDSLYGGAREQPRAVLYRSLFQADGGFDPNAWVGGGGLSFELRYRSGTSLVEAVHRAVASVDRNVPIFRVKTLRAQTEDSLVRERLLATVSSFFGGLAGLLALLGLYGLMACAVARRTAEIGIRMALGARRQEIIWLILRETLGLVLAGIALGIPLALALSRYAKSLLFGIAPADPVVMAASAAVLIVIAAVAGFLPARRASRIDPMVALRYE
jgi:predicted permease